MTRLEALIALKEAVEAGAWFPGLAQQSFGGVQPYHNARNTFEGSLDAARALHEAVPTPNAIMSDEDAKIILFGKHGARHWLIWKISALIAQEQDT